MADLERFDAPGLPADWLNAWLAAIGVTAILPEVKLSWTDDVVPHAVFWIPEGEWLPELIIDALPTVEDLGRAAIARQHPDSAFEFGQKAGIEAYRDRAALERRDGAYLLAAAVTDLGGGDPRRDPIQSGPFNTPAPRGETLYTRWIACRRNIDGSEQVEGSFVGTRTIVKANGLGFDCRRLPPGIRVGKADDKYVDPVVECLILMALRAFPTRGDGRQVRQRGWSGTQFRHGAFRWFSWEPALDFDAIDAVIDQPRLVTTAEWRVVPLQLVNAADPTRALFSERVR